MAEMTKSNTLWIILGIVFLLFVLNQWMSREINHPVTPVSQSPEETVIPPTEKVQMTQTFPLPVESQEDSSVPAITAEPKDASPKVGEKVNEPVYEPPTNNVILVE